MITTARLWLAAGLLMASQPTLANAKPANCVDGYVGDYRCEFVFLDDRGSFRASSFEHGTIMLLVEQPGFGELLYRDEERDQTFRRGVFRRMPAPDDACWQNINEASDIFCAY